MNEVIIKTTGGSVASDAQRLAKPVLLGAEVDLPAADHALFMHACMHALLNTPCKLLLLFSGYWLPLDNQQHTIHQRLPHPTPGQGCRSCPASYYFTAASPLNLRCRTHYR
eukprot:487630-Pelagomonas_calceolata.AAC.7